MTCNNNRLTSLGEMQEFGQAVLGFLDRNVHKSNVATGSYFVNQSSRR